MWNGKLRYRLWANDKKIYIHQFSPGLFKLLVKELQRQLLIECDGWKMGVFIISFRCENTILIENPNQTHDAEFRGIKCRSREITQFCSLSNVRNFRFFRFSMKVAYFTPSATNMNEIQNLIPPYSRCVSLYSIFSRLYRNL